MKKKQRRVRHPDGKAAGAGRTMDRARRRVLLGIAGAGGTLLLEACQPPAMRDDLVSQEVLCRGRRADLEPKCRIKKGTLGQHDIDECVYAVTSVEPLSCRPYP